MQEELARWTPVCSGPGRPAEDAEELGVVGVPALRIRTPGGQQVAEHDGYLAPDELVDWLKKHYDAATAAADDVLLDSGEPSAAAVVRLVKQFQQRNPALREAAIRRLLPYPDVARPLVRQGVSRRAAWRRVWRRSRCWSSGRRRWTDLDPWRPETFTPERLARLEKWKDEKSAGDQSPPKELSDGATGRRPAADRADAGGRRGGGRRDPPALGAAWAGPVAGGLRAAEERRDRPGSPPAVDLALPPGGLRFARAALAGRVGTAGGHRSAAAPAGGRGAGQAGRRRRSAAAARIVRRHRSAGPRDQPARPAAHRRQAGQRRAGEAAWRSRAERPRGRAEAVGRERPTPRWCPPW